MIQRLFVAIPLSMRFVKAFDVYRDTMGKRTPWAQWIAIRNLHITVLFIGNVSERHVSMLIGELRNTVMNSASFSLILGKVVYAPPKSPPRMVWALFKENEAFTKLVADIAEAVKAEGLGIGDGFVREKIAHATLARFKRKSPTDKLVRLKQTGLEGEEMLVKELLLMESKLNRNGAEYKIIAKLPLGSA